MASGLRFLLDLPLIVILMALAALAMLAPAAHAYALGLHDAGRPFFYSAIVFLLLTAMIGIATSNRATPARRPSHLKAFVGAYLVLPLLLAVPFNEAVPDTSFRNAWFEMVSSFTTTGATLYDTPGRLPASLHLWRAIVGWLGGFYILLMGVAVLMPLNLGGMEVIEGRSPGHTSMPQMVSADPSQRLVRFTLTLLPAYAGFTLLLWILLTLAGEGGFHALCLAMATVSTSGILPEGGDGPVLSGFLGEACIAAFLTLGLTRRAYPGAFFADRSLPLHQDPEVRMAVALVGGVTAVLFLRHWVGAIDNDEGQDLWAIANALWGTAFTALSFLTTTGFAAEQWVSARIWSGLENHGLILLGLAMIGGGVATTAGGVKLLRVYALFRHGQFEMEKLLHPHSVGGAGGRARQLRSSGAHVAWVFFMLFATSIAAVVAALTLVGVGFDAALILAIAALSTTGPLATLAGEVPVRLAELGHDAKLILGVAMVLGRVETLAVLALLTPDQWRR